MSYFLFKAKNTMMDVRASVAEPIAIYIGNDLSTFSALSLMLASVSELAPITVSLRLVNKDVAVDNVDVVIDVNVEVVVEDNVDNVEVVDDVVVEVKEDNVDVIEDKTEAIVEPDSDALLALPPILRRPTALPGIVEPANPNAFPGAVTPDKKCISEPLIFYKLFKIK